MRRTHFYLALLALLLCAASAAAQAEPPPPPPPAPDYFPDRWKEYVFERDNVKFRFPAEPQAVTASRDTPSGRITQRSYRRVSFLLLELRVYEFPEAVDLEHATPPKELFGRLRDEALAGAKNFNPRVVREEDVTVEGHAARFLQVENDRGSLLRMKLFAVRNRVYVAAAEVRKGERHGFNSENDFEKVAMGFLDSVRPIAPPR